MDKQEKQKHHTEVMGWESYGWAFGRKKEKSKGVNNQRGKRVYDDTVQHHHHSS
jgi:hypothetical protein